MKSPFIVANWKMNKTIGEATEYAGRLKGSVSDLLEVHVILAAPFTALWPLAEVIRGSRIALAAQNIHWEDGGPYTGEISALQARDAGCNYVILGHSERRQHFGEGYEQVNKKIQAALRHDLNPIVCLGESLKERESNQTLEVIEEQMEKGLAGISPERFKTVLIAYEPVWAIGTGRPVTPQQAAEAHGFIRRKVRDLFGPLAGSSVRILYGGSVTRENAAVLMGEPEVDGLLVGGASLRFEEFSQIIDRAAQRSAS